MAPGDLSVPWRPPSVVLAPQRSPTARGQPSCPIFPWGRGQLCPQGASAAPWHGPRAPVSPSGWLVGAASGSVTVCQPECRLLGGFPPGKPGVSAPSAAVFGATERPACTRLLLQRGQKSAERNFSAGSSVWDQESWTPSCHF